ncbi:unnamed protein product [Allacma fusca]|uniref:Uncharacterized protein n=1 Tax=Allacma fusca TaxID=39272 RepID=A0A8J2P708_9HEXA|nr:unnamed protein product [Allacma fusca]
MSDRFKGYVLGAIRTTVVLCWSNNRVPQDDSYSRRRHDSEITCPLCFFFFYEIRVNSSRLLRVYVVLCVYNSYIGTLEIPIATYKRAGVEDVTTMKVQQSS